MDEINIKRDKSVKHFEKSESFTKKKGEKIMTKRFGFTLAEVLITLGIIGVVAAMTMPTLMNSTQGAQYKAAYKKALSAISQGVTLNVALDGGSFADTVAGTAGVTTKPTSGDSVASILNSRMNIVKASTATGNGYTNFPGKVKSKVCVQTDGKNETIKVCGRDDTPVEREVAPDTFLFFNDGSMFSFKAADAVSCTEDTNVSGHKQCVGVIDVNGTKGPNKLVTCDGKTDYSATVADCKVSSPTDIYPVVFYDQTILPATDAARAVLYGK